MNKRLKIKMIDLSFYLMMFLIGLVALIDVYFSFKHSDNMINGEFNPLGKFLIKLDDNSIALFMTLKMLSTMMVLSILPAIYHVSKKHGYVTCMGVFLFQAWLFNFLFS